MNKIWLIIKREYSTRVKNKTFLLTTFLAPLGIILFGGALGLIMSSESDEKKEIVVIDQSNLLDGEVKATDNITFTFTKDNLATSIEAYKNGTNNGVLEILPLNDPKVSKYYVDFHSDEQLALDESSRLERSISKKVRNYKLRELSISEELLSNLDTDISIQPNMVKSDKKVSSMTSKVGAILGGVVGYAMFFIILIYGMQVMRSVMEEKISRIVEVIISSVKPFELMMGKVIGVGLVGLTQVSIWLIMTAVMVTVGSSFFGLDASSMAGPGLDPELQAQAEAAMSGGDTAAQILNELSQLNWWKIIPLTLFYFLAGYFAYASLFAAIGSAVGEDINEANSLTMPIMMPLVFAVYIGVKAIESPNSSVAVWGSMIPLLSSIVMPTRLPMDPPMWQIIVSMVSLLAFVVFFTWLAGRIYRVGILMYGKKASFKELAKWIFYKG